MSCFVCAECSIFARSWNYCASSTSVDKKDMG